MSKTFSTGSRSMGAHRPTANGGDTTWRSIDTNVLLQNIDDLETARTMASVDTNLLLGDLETVPTPYRTSTVGTGPSISAETRTSSSSVRRDLVADRLVPPLLGNASRDSFDIMTARSVSSIDCAPAVYDTDRRHIDDVTGVSVSRDDFRYSADYEPDDTARSDASLEAAIRLRDSAAADLSSGALDDDVTTSPPRSAHTSRTLASVDTNILLKTTEDVVMAMELARERHEHAKLEYDVIELRRSPNDKTQTVGVSGSQRDYDANNQHTDTDASDDTSALMTPTATVEKREMSSVGGGNVFDDIDKYKVNQTNSDSPNSFRNKPPAHGRKSTTPTTTQSWTVARNGVTQAWRSLSDLDMHNTDHSKHHQKIAAVSATSMARGLTATADIDISSTTDCSSDITPSSLSSSAFYVRGNSRDHLLTTGGRSRTKTKQDLMDSSRSMTSGASLGQKIVARSRENMKPTIKSRHPVDGRRDLTKHSAASGKQVTFQKHSTSGGRQSSSPSGLVLEGYSVPVRPSSTTVLKQHQRPAGDRLETQAWSSADKTVDRLGFSAGAQNQNDSGLMVRSAWRHGEMPSATSHGQSNWLSDSSPGFASSLYAHDDGVSDLDSVRDEQVRSLCPCPIVKAFSLGL
jgi:hypothetical protein